MNEAVKQLKGSAARDHFKYMYKQMMSRQNYALDVDLELVEKFPFPFIVARLDYKRAGEGLSLTFTEALSYQYIAGVPTPLRIPVYIVEGLRFSPELDETEHRFNVYELISADYKPNPPTWQKKQVLREVNWSGLAAWEDKLRTERRQEITQGDAVLLARYLWERLGRSACYDIHAEWTKFDQKKFQGRQ